MAESGDADDLRHSILMGSEVEYDFTCHPCNSAGRNIEARGYCTDCGIHLCGQCTNYHKTLPVTAHHEVVDKNKMPTKHDAPPVKVICTERCQVHKDNFIEYFCPAHNFLGCNACITLKHATCQDMEYIPETATGLGDKAEYKVFKRRLDDLIKKSKDTIQYGQESLKRAADNHDKVIQEIEAYQQELNETLNKLKHDIKQQADQVRDTDFGVMNSITDEGSEVLAELESMAKEINEQLSKKHYSQMYIQMKYTENKLAELENKMGDINKTFISIYDFKKNLELLKMLERMDGLGTLVTMIPSEIRATHVTDIKVKTRLDKETCWVAAATMLSKSDLVITDSSHTGTIKLIDVDKKKVLSSLKLENYPFHVTKVDINNLAVTIPNAKEILLLRYDKVKGLVIDREIKVDAECWGIAYAEDKLVVSFLHPAEVRILNMNGYVLQTFATDGRGNKLFKDPGRVAIGAHSRCIYVSEWKQNCVIMLDMNGNVQSVYKDDELNEPSQVAVDHKGVVYLCGRASNNIHLLTDNFKKVKVLLGKTDGLRRPRGICYCDETHRLYVGMRDSNVVKAYQLA